MQDKDRFKILFVSAEAAPFAKTGGLADVAGSLPKALASMGSDVRIVMPRYKMIESPMKYVTDFPIEMDHRKETCIIKETTLSIKDDFGDKSIPVYFTDNHGYFNRSGIYCHYDDADRFAFFCKAVIEMLPAINFQPDVIHCNDWHAGPVCMLLKEKYRSQSFYAGIATVFTIHNLEYQGNFNKETMKLFNIGGNIFTPEKVEFYGSFSFMKAGLVYSDIISTVSETYAKEIQTPEFGRRFDGLLRKRSAKLFGITNGISYDEFDPGTDKSIYKNYNIETFENKKENKYALQKEMGLPRGDMPLIGLISRLSDQKGLDLIIEGIDQIMDNDLQFVLLGTGDEYFENTFKNIQAEYPKKISIFIGFNPILAQKIYAASDMFLMPSKYEPCGLGQIISLRYGTVPIVRATGGLAETVSDYDEDNEEGNGFSFTEYSAVKMVQTVERALKLYNEKPEIWKALIKRALAQDFSWNKPAQKYMDLYRRVIKYR